MQLPSFTAVFVGREINRSKLNSSPKQLMLYIAPPDEISPQNVKR